MILWDSVPSNLNNSMILWSILCFRVSKEQKCSISAISAQLGSGKGFVAGTTLGHKEYFQNCFINRIYKDYETQRERIFGTIFFCLGIPITARILDYRFFRVVGRKKPDSSGYRLVSILNIEGQLLQLNFYPQILQIEHFHDDYLEKWCVAKPFFIRHLFTRGK